jgi:hypothetical protein
VQSELWRGRGTAESRSPRSGSGSGPEGDPESSTISLARLSPKSAISPTDAATISANVANLAASLEWPTEYPQGIFCSKFTTQMGKQFETYPNLGARMM